MEHGSRRVTIADVAEAAGVSKTSVSFAFNNPDRLNTRTATRILDIAESLGYRPDPVARMLTERKTRTLGVLTPQTLAQTFANPFFGMLSAGIGEVAEASGYAMQFISPLHGSLSRAIARATVDGVVAIGLTPDHPEIAQLRRARLPMVTVDAGPVVDRPSVDVDDEGGARAAAEHLLELGHRDLLVLVIERPDAAGQPEADDVVGRRMRGYRSAFEAAGLTVPDDRIVVSAATTAGGRAATEAALAAGASPTAVLAMSDAMALGAIRALKARGLAVPGDVSVVGFDDIELAESTDPPLTTVHQPVREKGEEAVRLLLATIEGREEPPQHRRLETRLIVRASTAPVSRGR